MEFHTAARKWLAAPEARNLAALHNAIQAQANYRTAPHFQPIVEALRVGDYRMSLGRLKAEMPGAFLSPLAHSLLSRTYRGLGRSDDAAREQALAQASLIAILNSGDGSPERPWVVLRVSDEYDVLDALGEKCAVQTPVQAGWRFRDRIETRQGNTYWFDLLRGGRRTRGAA